MNNIAFHEAIPGYFEDLGSELWLKLAIFGDQPAKVSVRIEPDNEEFLIPMNRVSEKAGWVHYEAKVVKSEHIDLTLYLFKLVWEKDSQWLSAVGLEPHMPINAHMFRYTHDRRLPTWSCSQVFYQIFPDRFANGDPSITPTSGEYKYLGEQDIVVKQWDDLPSSETGGFEFFGGDLPGIESKLSYLNDTLGVTALYLNPVFSSQSNHKYDTTDYYNVDKQFGGNDALESLISSMKSRDMPIVLDAVINHTSLAHPWVESAKNGHEVDKTRFVWSDEGYIWSWKGHHSLPVLDFGCEQNVTDFITGEDSVIRKWMQPPYAIDGWRMDVVHMLGEGKGARNNDKHLRTLRETVKHENEHAMLLGEHFFEATDWLQGDQEDCAMNYFGFAHPIRAFLANLDISGDPVSITALETTKWMRQARARVSFSHQLMQFNQLDSHDTPRFLTMLNGNKARMKMAISILMSYIGVPCLYYATEIGMEGGADPDCRRTFPWDESQWDENIFTHTQHWINIRKTYPALQTGALVDVYADQDCFVYARVLGEQTVLVAVNRGEAKDQPMHLNFPNQKGSWKALDANTNPSVTHGEAIVSMPAESVQAWVLEK
ncbi:maltodextrin glucosidase [Reinekea marina]|uniref:Maltodextrin glucosidase n=1 Tax=Reinekea marina TaxID=1310421 RepID=A0ABV7WRF2_9GAMM|nr:maltodextrin glucosidase [Reinekea marina]MDN3648741.1 maltodextrin glucosidase [Reinekea marina]